MIPNRRPGRITCVTLLALGVGAAGAGCAGVPAQYRTSSPIALQSGFLSGYKYTHRQSEPTKVFGLVSYSSGFRELLSQQPEAWAEAERGVPFHYIALASTAGFTLYTIVTLADQFNDQSNASTFAELNEAGEITGTDIAVMLGFAAVTAVAGRAARSHLLNAVGLFNGGATSTGIGAARFPIRPSALVPKALWVDPARESLGIGWRLQPPTGW